MPRIWFGVSFFGSCILYPLVADLKEEYKRPVQVNIVFFVEDRSESSVAVVILFIRFFRLQILVDLAVESVSPSHQLRSGV